jgi:hypothetical protein
MGSAEAILTPVPLLYKDFAATVVSDTISYLYIYMYIIYLVIPLQAYGSQKVLGG